MLFSCLYFLFSNLSNYFEARVFQLIVILRTNDSKKSYRTAIVTYGQNNGSNRDARYIKSLYSHILDDEDLLLLEDSVAEVDVDSMET